MSKPATAQVIEDAARAYKFRLESSTSDRCFCCQHKIVNSSQNSFCGLLNIFIAQPDKSRCPLFEND